MTESRPTVPNRLSRRQFIVGGSVAVAGVAAASTVGWRVLFGSGGGPRISVGFVDAGTDLWSGAARVVPASTVGSAPVAGVARIAGATPAFALGDGVGAHLDAIFPGGPEERRFFAWSHRGGPEPAQSSAVRFGLPDDGVTFELTIDDPDARGDDRDGDGDGEAAVPVARTLELGGGGTALRPGSYLFGLDADVWDSAGRLPARDDRAWADLSSVLLTVAPAA